MARCLEYTDESFLSAFIKQPDLNKPQKEFNIHYRARLFIVYSMVNIIFGTDLQTFILDKPFNRNESEAASKLLIGKEIPNLKHAQVIANKFDEAFEVYESFSLLKFLALTIPELNIIWKNIENFKKFFNKNIYALSYFADPMDWFQVKLINKHLALYASAFKEDQNSENDEQKNSDLFSTSSYMNQENESKSSSHSLTNRKFGYLNSFLSLTTNSIFKYPKNNLNTRLKFHSQKDTFRNRALTTTSDRFLQQNPKIRSFSERNSENSNLNKKLRTFSNDFKNLNVSKKPRMSYISTRVLNKETESNEFENWKLTIDEGNFKLIFFTSNTQIIFILLNSNFKFTYYIICWL